MKKKYSFISIIVTAALLLNTVVVSDVFANERFVDSDYSDNTSLSFDYEENIDNTDNSDNTVNIDNIDNSEEVYSNSENDVEPSYVENEVICLADTFEEAVRTADALDGVVTNYSYGVANIELPSDVTPFEAMELSDTYEDAVLSVWPNYIDKIEEINLEPYMQERAGQYYQWFHEFIGSQYAFLNDIKGQDVVVGVLDTGIRASHKDISANTLPGKNFYNGASGRPFDEDPQGHGSHVAGIIAAVGENNYLGSGIAPYSKVASYRVASPTGSANQADILRAIEACIEAENIKIINISIGGYSYNGAYAEVCKKAKEHGIAIFASAGNDSLNCAHYPSSYDDVISIAASDYTGASVYFSNYGDDVDFIFPGYNISSISNSNDTSYVVKSGTSMASPMAAGVAALILSANPELNKRKDAASVDELVKIMKKGAIKSSSTGTGAGTTFLPNALSLKTDPKMPCIDSILYGGNKYVDINANDVADGIKKIDLSQQKISIPSDRIEVEISTKNLSDVSIYYTLNGKNPQYLSNSAMLSSGTQKLSVYENGAKISGNIIINKEGQSQKVLKAIAVNDRTSEKSQLMTKTFVLSPVPASISIYTKDNVDAILQGESINLYKEVLPVNATVRNGKWWCDSNEITVTNNGQVKTTKNTKPGKYVIYYTCDGYPFEKVAFDLEVLPGYTNSSIKLSANKIKVPIRKVSDNNADYEQIADENLLKYVQIDGRPAKSGEVRFSVNNKNICTVDKLSGDLVAVKPGNAIVTASLNNGSKKCVKLNVQIWQPVNKINVTGTSIIAAGKTVKLNATVSPQNASNKKVVFKYNGTDGALKINGQNITASQNAYGTYDIEVTSADGGVNMDGPLIYSVNVAKGAITSIDADKDDRVVNLFTTEYKYNLEEFLKKYSNTTVLKKNISGTSGVSKNAIEFVSSNEKVATVDNEGRVSANSVGKAVITCKSVDGSNKKLTYTVNVRIPMSNLRLSPYKYSRDKNSPEIYIAKGKSVKMIAVYSSAYGKSTDKKLKWYSNNSDITVSNSGVVKVSKKCPEGATATITAECYYDRKVKSTYTVKVRENSNKSGFVKTLVKTNGAERSVYLAVKDSSITDKSALSPLNYCTYEVVGVGNKCRFCLLSYKDDNYSFKGYVPYAADRTTTLLYEDWNSEYNKVKNDEKSLNSFYSKTGKKMRIVCRLQDGTETTYYKEFWCFRMAMTDDESSPNYYSDKNMYVAIK